MFNIGIYKSLRHLDRGEAREAGYPSVELLGFAVALSAVVVLVLRKMSRDS